MALRRVDFARIERASFPTALPTNVATPEKFLRARKQATTEFISVITRSTKCISYASETTAPADRLTRLGETCITVRTNPNDVLS